MWEDEEDRQRVMARFRSFDMTGMTKHNSYNNRSPSQLTIEPNDNQIANNIGALRNAGTHSNEQILNIITKLPSINTSP